MQQMRIAAKTRAEFARSLKAEAAVVADFPGVTFGIHLCRGNQRSMWHREGTYDVIAERLFNKLPHDRFLLEYDTERAGSFAPLRFVPKGRVVVLGLVSTKGPELERPTRSSAASMRRARFYLSISWQFPRNAALPPTWSEICSAPTIRSANWNGSPKWRGRFGDNA